MKKTHIEEKETIIVNNKEYSVITKISENALPRKSLIKLSVDYAIQNLEEDYLQNG